VGTVWLTTAQGASARVYVRALDPDEAEARKVGLCDWWCSAKTLACPRPASMEDWCAVKAATRAACDANTRLGGCYACSIGANYTICNSKKGSDCTMNGATGQVCGFMKKAACNWNGTKCTCPGLPAMYNTDPCKDNNCK
jgi:hypothetical protein